MPTHVKISIEPGIRELFLKYIALGRDKPYFVNSDSNKTLSEIAIIRMLGILIDSIYVMFGGRACQQTVFITMSND